MADQSEEQWAVLSARLASWQAPPNECGGWQMYPSWQQNGAGRGYTGISQMDLQELDAWSLLRKRLEQSLDQVLLKWIDHRGFVTAQYTGQEIHHLVCLMSHRLEALKLQHGDRVLLSYPPTGLDFYFAYLACLKRGVVAVPVYPPSPGRLVTDLERLNRIVATCQAKDILTDSDYSKARQVLKIKSVLAKGRWPKVKWHVLDLRWAHQQKRSKVAGAIIRAETEAKSPVRPRDLAFLQFTSGSTGEPKGVMVAHSNLVQNSRIINWSCPRPHIAVSWLPMYHDMGLIGFYATLTDQGRWCTMSPFTFLKNPSIWIHCLSREQATFAPFPNFALELVLRKWQHMPQLLVGAARLDLSRLAFLLNGAEPVKLSSEEKFLAFFGPYGLRPDVFCNCYGLAEHTLLATICLDRGRKATLDPEGIQRVSCGPPSDGVDVRIVEPESCLQQPDGQVGEVWLHSASKAQGYYKNPEATEATFKARLAGQTFQQPAASEQLYLRTGDLGFVKNGELYLTGRVKDLIILQGRNYYPQDLELTVEETPHVRPGCVACFALETEQGEAVAVVAEVLVKSDSSKSSKKPPKGKKNTVSLYATLAQEIERNIVREHGVPVRLVALVKDRTIPKTTSGKIRRRQTKDDLLAQKLSILFLHNNSGVVAEEAKSDKWDAQNAKTVVASASTVVAASTVQPERGTATGAADTLSSSVSSGSLHSTSVPSSSSSADLGQPTEGLASVCAWVSQTVAGLVEESTGVPISLSPSDSLLEAGLTSQQAVEVTALIDTRFGLSVLPVVVFNYPTVQALAQHIRAELRKLRAGGGQELNTQIARSSQHALIGISFALGHRDLRQTQRIDTSKSRTSSSSRNSDGTSGAAALWEAMLAPPSQATQLLNNTFCSNPTELCQVITQALRQARLDTKQTHQREKHGEVLAKEGLHVYVATDSVAAGNEALRQIQLALPNLPYDAISSFGSSLEAVHQACLDLQEETEEGEWAEDGIATDIGVVARRRNVCVALVASLDMPAPEQLQADDPEQASSMLRFAATALVLKPLAALKQHDHQEAQDHQQHEQVAAVLVGWGLDISCSRAVQASLDSASLSASDLDFALASCSGNVALEKLQSAVGPLHSTSETREAPLVLSHLSGALGSGLLPASAGALALLEAVLVFLQGALPPGEHKTDPQLYSRGHISWASSSAANPHDKLEPYSLDDRLGTLVAAVVESECCLLLREYVLRRQPRTLMWNGPTAQRAHWPDWLS
eukprot:gb/GEZN01000641.1/.p1 GENE.gb/GEZN01000641.1/~~gb/GEZN01000641.1/.p1  ORF type:complete len:1248 (-),score=241.66 gb/GEZN01000641.1/:97-3840(-)